MKVALIGLGPMGLHHAADVRTLDFVTEVIGCDLSEERRARAASKGFRVLPSVEALLAEKPFAAIVATPPASHSALIRQCFAAGVPVLTEKPMTTDVREGRDLVALAAEKGLRRRPASRRLSPRGALRNFSCPSCCFLLTGNRVSDTVSYCRLPLQPLDRGRSGRRALLRRL